MQRGRHLPRQTADNNSRRRHLARVSRGSGRVGGGQGRDADLGIRGAWPSTRTKNWVSLRNVLCNVETVPRPPRTPDKGLADQLRLHMQAHGRSTADIGLALGINKATVSRSLREGAFSRALRPRVLALLRVATPADDLGAVLLKSLRLLQLSAQMQADAERMIAEALDRSLPNQ